MKSVVIESEKREEHERRVGSNRCGYSFWLCFLLASLLGGIPFAAILTLHLKDQALVSSTISATLVTRPTIGISSTSTIVTSTTAATTSVVSKNTSETTTSSVTQSTTTTTAAAGSSTSTTSTGAATTITTGPTCSATGRGTLATFSGTSPSSWNTYTYSYTATKSSTMLLFAVTSESIRNYYLDDVSVVDASLPGIQLLRNPSFENSSSLFGWSVWCFTTCSISSSTVASGTDCYASSGRCFKGNCDFGIGFLGQSFPTTIGNVYQISFRLIARLGLLSSNKFYVDLV